MKALLLGGGGFIGCHMAQKLLRSTNHEVYCYDLFDGKVQDSLGHSRFTYIHGDIRRDHNRVEQLIKDADVVIDLITYANPALYVAMPLDVFHLNFTENLKIAECCVKHRKRLIQFSTCEVYGKTVASLLHDQLLDPDNPAHALFQEDTTAFILGPVSKHRWIYSCAKQLLERIIHAYGLADRLNYTIVRPFNFIGPRIDFLPSEQDGNPRVFSHFLNALKTGTPMKLINGGHQRRAYTYIEDAVDCIARIIENPGGVCDKEIFNIGSPDNEISIRDLACKMQDLYKRHWWCGDTELPALIEVSGETFYGEGYDDSDRRIPDITKARQLLGWQPHYNLDQTLAQKHGLLVWRAKGTGVSAAADLKLAIVVPAYNASKTIERVFERIPTAIQSQIVNYIVVNDGSTDDTAAVLTRLQQAYPDVVALHHEMNQGYGAAEKTLLRHAVKTDADVVVLLHADGQYAPEELPKLIEPFVTESADIVQGSRMMEGRAALQGGMPRYKYVANRGLTAIENMTFRLNMAEYHSGYMLYAKRALREIPFTKLSDSFCFDQEMLIMAQVKGLKIIQRPIPTHYGDEVSHLKPIRYGLHVLSLVWAYKRGYYHAL